MEGKIKAMISNGAVIDTIVVSVIVNSRQAPGTEVPASDCTRVLVILASADG